MILLLELFHYSLKILITIIIDETQFTIKYYICNAKSLNTISNNAKSIKFFSCSGVESSVTITINNSNASSTVNFSGNIPPILPIYKFRLIFICQSNTKLWNVVRNSLVDNLVTSTGFQILVNNTMDKFLVLRIMLNKTIHSRDSIMPRNFTTL